MNMCLDPLAALPLTSSDFSVLPLSIHLIHFGVRPISFRPNIYISNSEAQFQGKAHLCWTSHVKTPFQWDDFRCPRFGRICVFWDGGRRGGRTFKMSLQQLLQLGNTRTNIFLGINMPQACLSWASEAYNIKEMHIFHWGCISVTVFNTQLFKNCPSKTNKQKNNLKFVMQTI